MGTVLWIVGGIVAVLVVGFFLLMFVDEWLTKRRRRNSMREWEEQAAKMSDAERAAAAAEARRSRLTMQLNHGGTAAMMAIRECYGRDIPILLSAFSLGDWQTRELVMAALGNICRDNKAGEDYEAAEMVSALRSIEALCSADSTGGSYRQNCLDHARMLLGREELQLPAR
jgi:hypothetical protein